MKNVKKGHTKPVVCLDAGHYGKYNRSPVVPAYYESVMAWNLHNYLATELEAYGINVVKTRAAQDVDLALVSRGKASKGCDLFISLHSNACDTESVDRPVAIYLVPDAASTIDEASKEIAGMLANTVRDVMQTTGKPQTLYMLSSNDRDGDGKKDDDYYGVLHGAHVVGTPGVIMEHSFHTNTKATKWLLVDSNLRALAKAEAKTIAAWFDVQKVEDTYTQKEFIREVQKACGATVDGIAGPETLSKTVTISANFNGKHAVVRPFQKYLHALGYDEVGKADGIAGPKFTAALAHFQQDNDCTPTGLAEAWGKTWQKMLGLK